MGRAGSDPKFHVNSGSGRVGSLHLWVGSGRVEKIGRTSTSDIPCVCLWRAEQMVLHESMLMKNMELYVVFLKIIRILILPLQDASVEVGHSVGPARVSRLAVAQYLPLQPTTSVRPFVRPSLRRRSIAGPFNTRSNLLRLKRALTVDALSISNYRSRTYRRPLQTLLTSRNRFIPSGSAQWTRATAANEGVSHISA